MNSLLTTEQAAEYTGLAPITLSLYRHRHVGPCYIKIGRSVRYRQEDLDAWLDALRIETNPRSSSKKQRSIPHAFSDNTAPTIPSRSKRTRATVRITDGGQGAFRESGRP